MDPEFDRPEVLKEYAARYGRDPAPEFRLPAMPTNQLVAGLWASIFENRTALISHDLQSPCPWIDRTDG